MLNSFADISHFPGPEDKDFTEAVREHLGGNLKGDLKMVRIDSNHSEWLRGPMRRLSFMFFRATTIPVSHHDPLSVAMHVNGAGVAVTESSPL